jgi:hypothetical protein
MKRFSSMATMLALIGAGATGLTIGIAQKKQ